MYFITIKRMLEVCFSAHPNIQYRAIKSYDKIYRDKVLREIGENLVKPRKNEVMKGYSKI